MYETIKLDDMRVFHALATAGTFTAAATQLRMPKQTVSRRVAELERQLNTQLVQRTTRSVTLTEVGRRYANRCAEVLQLADEANTHVLEHVNAAPSGTLRVTSDAVFAENFLPPILDAYLREYPQVSVDLVLTGRHVDLVEEGVDAAIRIGVLEQSSLMATKLGSAKICYCASPTYLEVHGTPRTPQDLATHQCVLQTLNMGAPRWPFRGHPEPEFLPVSGRFQVNEFEMAKRMALAGHGILLSPAFACEAYVRSGELVHVLDDFLVEDLGGIYLVVPPTRYTVPKVRAFTELVTKAFANQQDWERDTS